MQTVSIASEPVQPPHGLATVASRFSLASLELLRNRALLRRTDTKFLLPSDVVVWSLAAVVNDYRLLPSGDRHLARYSTVYFDTPDLLCFNEHRRGRRPRHKVRIRHYLDRGRTYFEIKSKQSSGITTKYREERPYGDGSFTDEDRQTVTRECGLPAGDLRPSLRIDFARMTLLGKESEERITIDFNLAFDGAGPSIKLDGVSIIEVKQPKLCRSTPIMRVLRAHGQRPSQASKYCTALALCRPSVRTNQVRSVLRTLERIRQ